MANIYDYSKPFDETFLGAVKGLKEVILTQEKFQELVGKNDEFVQKIRSLEEKTHTLEKKLFIARSVISYILNGDILPSRIEILEFANRANAQIQEL